MASLVADYSDSDGEVGSGWPRSEQTPGALFYEAEASDSYSDDDVDSCKASAITQDSVAVRDQLPHPNFGDVSASKTFGQQESPSAINGSSVFANPFLAEEEAKNLALERHVKMTSNAKSQSRTINGHQVCWNHRKGRCRFGHKCKFAHDTDVGGKSLGSSTTTGTERTDSLTGQVDVGQDRDAAEESESSNNNKKRKKPGLSNTLVPPKRSMKAYKKQQHQEQPWLQA